MPFVDPLRQALGIGDEEVVADELALLADKLGQNPPTLPVIFRHAIFDRGDRIGLRELGEILCLLFDRSRLALALIDILALLEEFGRGAVERQDTCPCRAYSPPARSPS